MPNLQEDARAAMLESLRSHYGPQPMAHRSLAAGPNGELLIVNDSIRALEKAQRDFAGAAELLGVRNEDDVQALVDELRLNQPLYFISNPVLEREGIA